MWNKLLLLLFAGLLAACGGAGENYYRLSADRAGRARCLRLRSSLGVGPVSLPSYIDRSELVFQSGPNEFQIPTERALDRLAPGKHRPPVASDLGADSWRAQSATPGREPGVQPRYRVALDLRQFHGISGRTPSSS